MVYPAECCAGYDCAPVDSVEWVAGAIYQELGVADPPPAPVMIITTRIGTVAVPPNFPRRQSQDNRFHACITTVQGATRLLCIFVPPSS